jgi:hypothetical protein
VCVSVCVWRLQTPRTRGISGEQEEVLMRGLALATW